jgi:hypothetical protein
MYNTELRNKYVRKLNKKILQVSDGINILAKIDKKLNISQHGGTTTASTTLQSNDNDSEKLVVGDINDPNCNAQVNLNPLTNAVNNATGNYTWISKDLMDKIKTQINAAVLAKNYAVEEKNQALKEKDQALKEKDQALKDKDTAIKDSSDKCNKLRDQINALREKLAKLAQTLNDKEIIIPEDIDTLINSTSLSQLTSVPLTDPLLMPQ